MNTQKLAMLTQVINRVGLPFVFFSFGIWELVNPDMWVGLVPAFLTSVMSAEILVIIHGVVLCVVGLAMLIGFMLRYAYAVASLILLEIVVGLIIQSGFTPILVRDIGLLAYALILTLGEWQKGQSQV